MKIIALSDTHLGYSYGYSKEAKSRVKNAFYWAYKFVIDEAIRKKADLVLHGGDVFDRPNPKKQLIAKFFSPINNLNRRQIPFVAVPGNHERGILPASLNQFFNNNLHFFNSLSIYHHPELPLSVIGFPYTSRGGNERMIRVGKLANKYSSRKIIVTCHQSFENSKFGPHRFSFDQGDGIISHHKLPKNVICVLSGHIHRAQFVEIVKRDKTPVIHIGSTEKTTWFEAIEPKGYLEINVFEDSFDIKFHEISSIPMFVVEMNVRNSKINKNSLLDLIPDKNSRVLVRFIGRKIMKDEIDEMKLQFSYRDYPLVSYSPNNPQTVLNSLYRGEFDFKM